MVWAGQDRLASSSGALTSLAWSGREGSTLAGGTHAGAVLVWDTRAGPDPRAGTGFAASHTEPVYSTVWTASKTGTELMTGSSEGTVCWY